MGAGGWRLKPPAPIFLAEGFVLPAAPIFLAEAFVLPARADTTRAKGDVYDILLVCEK